MSFTHSSVYGNCGCGIYIFYGNTRFLQTKTPLISERNFMYIWIIISTGMIRGLHRYFLRYPVYSFEECIEIILKHLFYREEMGRDLLMEILIPCDDRLRLSIRCEEESSHFRVDEVLSLIRYDLLASLSTEIVPFRHIWCEILRADLGIKSKSHDHSSRNLCRALDI